MVGLACRLPWDSSRDSAAVTFCGSLFQSTTVLGKKMRYGSDHKQILQRDTVLFKVGLFGWQLVVGGSQTHKELSSLGLTVTGHLGP